MCSSTLEPSLRMNLGVTQNKYIHRSLSSGERLVYLVRDLEEARLDQRPGDLRKKHIVAPMEVGRNYEDLVIPC